MRTKVSDMQDRQELTPIPKTLICRSPKWEGRTYLEQLALYHNYKKAVEESGDGPKPVPQVDPHEELIHIFPRYEQQLNHKWDAQRVLVGQTIMLAEATATSAKEVNMTIDVSCSMTASNLSLCKSSHAPCHP